MVAAHAAGRGGGSDAQGAVFGDGEGDDAVVGAVVGHEVDGFGGFCGVVRGVEGGGAVLKGGVWHGVG